MEDHNLFTPVNLEYQRQRVIIPSIKELVAAIEKELEKILSQGRHGRLRKSKCDN